MKELLIVANDRVGLLADISEALSKKNINIEGIDADVTGKKAVCRVLTGEADLASAKQKLQGKGFKVLDSDILVVKLVNKPGELSGVARVLADNGINVKNVHLLTKTEEYALCAFSVNKPSLAKELLAAYIE